MLQILQNWVMVIGVKALLTGKEVVCEKNHSLGIVTGLKANLRQGSMLMIVVGLNGELRHVSIDEIARLDDRITVFGTAPI